MKDHDFAYKNTIPGQLNTTESKNGLKTKLRLIKLILFIETEWKKVTMATSVPSFSQNKSYWRNISKLNFCMFIIYRNVKHIAKNQQCYFCYFQFNGILMANLWH